MISYKVFMSFVDEDGNASRMQSKECFRTWVLTRKSPPKKPQESFRRVLTAHACGVDGRRPFPENVEASLLKVLRRKEVWDCFRGTGVSIGIRGFRNIGYHEKLRQDAILSKSGSVPPPNAATIKTTGRSRKRILTIEKEMMKKRKDSNEDRDELLEQQVRVQQQILEQMKQYNMHLMNANRSQQLVYQPTTYQSGIGQPQVSLPTTPTMVSQGHGPSQATPSQFYPAYQVHYTTSNAQYVGNPTGVVKAVTPVYNQVSSQQFGMGTNSQPRSG